MKLGHSTEAGQPVKMTAFACPHFSRCKNAEDSSKENNANLRNY